MRRDTRGDPQSLALPSLQARPAPTRPLTLTGAQALVRVLQAEQVPAVFGIVGGKLAPLLHALSHSNIPFHGTRHEAAASMMAAAVYAGTGRIAVALGEMGPGGLNLASGTGVAFNKIGRAHV